MNKGVLYLAILVGVLIWAAVLWLPDGKLHVITCDVGQGDAILIIRGATQVLVDGGYGSRVLDCLAKYIPFYDRRIELVVATHPDQDHIGGLVGVIKRYNVLQFVSVPIGKETGGVEKLVQAVKDEKAKVVNLYTGDVIQLQHWKMEVVWPDKNWVVERVVGDDRDVVSRGVSVMGLSTESETNDFSIGLMVRYGDFDAYLTGDADARILPNQIDTGLVGEVEVLKVPHHGSRTGMSREWLDVLSPQLAILSVGKNNRYGHPSSEVMTLLGDLGIRYLRTDEMGDIEVVSDGRSWWVKMK